jgi:signal transduction histidine kinase
MRLFKEYPLHRVWLAAFTVIVIVLAGNSALAYKTLGDLARNQRSVANTLGTINTVTDAYAALLNAEAGQRGYLLTGERKYLEPLRNGIHLLEHYLQELEAATATTPVQQRLVKQLQRAAQEKVEELNSVVTDLQVTGIDRVPMGLLTSQGKPKMDKVRELVEQLKVEQYSLLAERQREARRSFRNAMVTLITATAVSLLLILLIYFLVKSSSNTREKLNHDLQKVNEELEEKVKERTTALTHYANELGRSNRELQDFAFVASHDLQEPLRKIRAFGNRLQQKYADALGDQGGDYVNRMQAAAERMSRLINDLLAFSRVTTKGRPFQPTELNAVADDVLDDLEVAIEESGAQITVGNLPAVEADPTQMRQLFQNLIGNALKFRHPDTPPRVTIVASTLPATEESDDPAEEVCEITVSDNGIGFDEQFLERIFTPFQRLHGREQYAGTGIGLAVCRRIVERHNGSITAESTPGEGATFMIQLPIKQRVKTTIHEIDDYDPQ